MSSLVKQALSCVALLTALSAGIFAIDSQYARSESLSEGLAKKADASVVYSLQKGIIENRIDELEYNEYILSKKLTPTELEQWRIAKIKKNLSKARMQLLSF